MKSSIAKHYSFKHARHCGLIANGRSQENRDFSCVRNINCGFANYAATRVIFRIFMQYQERFAGYFNVSTKVYLH